MTILDKQKQSSSWLFLDQYMGADIHMDTRQRNCYWGLVQKKIFLVYILSNHSAVKLWRLHTIF